MSSKIHVLSSSSDAGGDAQVDGGHHLPLSPPSSPIPFSFLSQVLDEGKKGYVAKFDVIQAAWSVGIEPTMKEMTEILEELSTNQKLDDDYQAELPKLSQLFEKANISADTLRESLASWRTSLAVKRPDTFIWRPWFAYFVARFVMLNITPLIWLWPWPMFPTYTAYERGIAAVSTNVIGGFYAFAVAIICVVLGSLQAGLLRSVTKSEVATVVVLQLIIAFVTQASREGVSWGEQGRMLRDAWQFRLRCLRYEYFASLDLKNGEVYLPGAGGGSETKSIDVLFTLLETVGGLEDNITRLSQIASHEQALQEAVERGREQRPQVGRGSDSIVATRAFGRRKSSVVIDEFNAHRLASATRGIVSEIDSKYNMLARLREKLDLTVVISQGIAISLSALPQIVRWVKGEPTVFNADYSHADRVISLLMTFSSFLTIEFCVLIIIMEAISETRLTNQLGMSLCNLIGDKSALVNGGSSRHQQPFLLRLNNVQNTASFKALLKFVVAYYQEISAVHIKACESLVCISITSAVVVLASVISSSSASFNVSNVTLFVMGTVLLLPLGIVLSSVCSTQNILTARIIRGLHNQRRMNVELIFSEIYRKDKKGERTAQLEEANIAIDSLIEDITESDVVMTLFNFFSLTTSNVSKVLGSIVIVLCTTVVKKSLGL